ncbi:MAG TPA: RNA polymerase sigma factor [Firmicutes bacterium]|nr:RNA polymerase sigma factor [Bacillota bacterium]
MENREDFEELLRENRCSVERFVKFRLPSMADAEDVLQEVYLTACRKFGQLKNRGSFLPWMLRIARSKCSDYFREKAGRAEISLDAAAERDLPDSRCGVCEAAAVEETLCLLGDRDRQILTLYFWGELPQAEIAKRLNLPLGTVKSRLFSAKQNFKSRYPYPPLRQPKGEGNMKRLPEFLPQYTIQESVRPPFAVKWEELMGWFLVPKLGEKLSWGMYDLPSRQCSHVYNMRVTGRAVVHGIEGVELTAAETSYSGRRETVRRTFVAQLTDTHCRYLAALRDDGGVRHYITFLDGDAFMPNWGFGEDNCGNETNLSPKGDIKRIGRTVVSNDQDFLLDIVGRYTVSINGRSFDTVCVMDIETYNSGVVSEQFLDRNGKTILWRRFNRDDWAVDRYGKKWSEQLPENERLIINGKTYVHWYDCITDYIL